MIRGRRGVLAAACTLIASLLGCSDGAGGGGEQVPSCDDVELGGYSVSSSLFKTGDDGFPGVAATVTGVVEEVGVGPLGTSCFETIAEASVAYAKLDDADGVSWTVCAPGDAIPVAVGQTITVAREVWVGDISPSASELTIRRDGQLVLVAVGRANANEQGQPPELHVTTGELLCASEDPYYCDQQKYAGLAVAGEDDSGAPSAEIQPGGTATVGDFEVHFGRLERNEDNGGCESGSGALHYYAIRKD